MRPVPTSLLLILVLSGVLAVASDAAAQHLAPHFPGWERHFSVSWKTFERAGRPYLAGYVVNRYGTAATRVQLLVDSLDASGQIVAQRVEWVGGTVPGFSRRYFEAPVPQPAASYRVSVFAFDFLQAGLVEGP